VLVLFLAGVGITAYIMLRPGAHPANPTPTPTPTTLPKAKPDLVPIDSGTFQMGRKNGPAEETPAHLVTVQPFFMDRTEVTNKEYADFVRETNHPAPAHWIKNKPAAGQELWPVVNVSLEDATAFAAWRSERDGVGYRLPTEEEWEYAARNGEQNDLYPWGPDWKDKAAVLKDATLSPVGSRPEGKNKWGVVDLVGNAWEWTSSKISSYPGNKTVIGPESQDLVTIRGGCYATDPGNPDTPVSACMRQFISASTKSPLVGFRLVRSQ
jgi:serine/threonine-protein kinase